MAIADDYLKQQQARLGVTAQQPAMPGPQGVNKQMVNRQPQPPSLLARPGPQNQPGRLPSALPQNTPKTNMPGFQRNGNAYTQRMMPDGQRAFQGRAQNTPVQIGQQPNQPQQNTPQANMPQYQQTGNA
jgi:hypothetical protein